jgi:hypothetical protein
MKRIHWWTLVGVSGAGLMVALLGPTVWGQPDARVPLPLPPALMAQPRATGGQLPDLPPMLPMLPVSKPGVIGTVTEPLQPGHASQLLKMDAVAPTAAKTDTQPHAALSFDVPPGRQQSAVSIEWVGPTAIRIHQPMPCQILVRNTSSAPAQNVIVRHRLGQGITVKACEPQAVNENGELVWNLGTLAPEQARRIELTLVSQTRGATNCHATVTFSAVAGHQVQVREPKLAVKMRAPEKIVAGETVTLLFAVSNPGDGVAELIKLKVMLPEGLEHPRGKIVEFDVGSLAPKEIRTMQLASVAKGTGPQKCMIVATGDGNLTCNDTASIDVLMPKLDIAMAGPKMRYLYRHAIYTLKVTNPGSAPATSVEVQELIPAGFRLHQAQGGQYQEAARLVSWNLGDLQPGQSKEIAVDLIPIEAGEHRLIAHAKTARGLKTETEVCTIVEGLPSLEMEVSHMDDPIEVGAETAFEIRVANKGTKTETNLEVVCTLPEQLEFLGAKCTTTLRYRQEGRELIFEKMPRLAPRAEEIFRVQVKGIAPGDIRFRTRIRADGLKDPVQREESMRIYSDGTPQKPAPVSPAPVPVGPSVPVPNPLPTPSIPPGVTPEPVPVVPTPVPLPVPTPGPLPTPVVPTPGTLPLPIPGIPPLPTPAPGPINIPGPVAPAIPLPSPAGM